MGRQVGSRRGFGLARLKEGNGFRVSLRQIFGSKDFPRSISGLPVERRQGGGWVFGGSRSVWGGLEDSGSFGVGLGGLGLG